MQAEQEMSFYKGQIIDLVNKRDEIGQTALTWDELVTQERAVASNIRRRLSGLSDFQTAAKLYYGLNPSDQASPTFYPNPFWFSRVSEKYIPPVLTDRAKDIYPNTSYYHVTSTLALDGLVKLGRLVPVVFHKYYDIKTHKGVGLKLLKIIFNGAGLDYFHKDEFVWSGKRVDAEQVKIEDAISKMGPDVNKQLIGLIYDGKGGDYTLKPEIRNIFEKIYDEKVDDESQVKGIQFLERFTELTGIRGYWYKKLKSIFRGEIPMNHLYVGTLYSKGQVIEDLERFGSLYFLYDRSGRRGVTINDDSDGGSVCILEFNAHDVLDRTSVAGTNLLSASKRHPAVVLGSTYVPVDSIKTIYCDDSQLLSYDVRLRFGDVVKPISELPNEAFLEDKRPDRLVILDPENPSCKERYETDFLGAWRKVFEAGLVAPAAFRDIGVSFLLANNVVNTFGPEVFGKYPPPVKIMGSEEYKFVDARWLWQLKKLSAFAKDNFMGLQAVFN